MPEPEPELLGEEGEEAGEEEEVEEFEDVDDVADTPNEKLLRTSRIDMMTQPESYRNNTQKVQRAGGLCTWLAEDSKVLAPDDMPSEFTKPCME